MRNYKFVQVGSTVVGAFKSDAGIVRCINRIAVGSNPKIKKGYKPVRPVTQMRNKSEARQQTNRVGNYERIRYLKPGDFTL